MMIVSKPVTNAHANRIYGASLRIQSHLEVGSTTAASNDIHLQLSQLIRIINCGQVRAHWLTSVTNARHSINRGHTISSFFIKSWAGRAALFLAERPSAMTSFEASERHNIKEEHERSSTKPMAIQRHRIPSESGGYGGDDEVDTGSVSGFSEPSSPRAVRTEEPPAPLNSAVATDAALAHLVSIDASPHTIRRLLESAVAEVADEMEEEPRQPSAKTESNNT
ncbi:hypothetical protein TcWFU_005649 [Taenia crassiceps]|uniref:Uncharacterized protein n=1 Tax=Taenia crassiceps TaxID=6207 RepID=A0ABR4Q3W0_9CEST